MMKKRDTPKHTNGKPEEDENKESPPSSKIRPSGYKNEWSYMDDHQVAINMLEQYRGLLVRTLLEAGETMAPPTETRIRACEILGHPLLSGRDVCYCSWWRIE